MTHEARLTGVRICGATVLGMLFVLSAALVSAQESTVTFPVPELGNCTSKSKCRAYCDDLAHVKECVAFAESHGLMSAGEAQQAPPARMTRILFPLPSATDSGAPGRRSRRASLSGAAARARAAVPPKIP